MNYNKVVAMSELLKTVSYAKSIEVLNYLKHEPKRFTDVGTDLGLNPNVVNNRLKDLQRANMVTKTNGKYAITTTGLRALEIVQQLRALR